MTMQKQKITPFLWFDTQAEEAAKFYLSVFKDGKITATTYYGLDGPGPKGSVMTVTFEINGQDFVALNGGPNFKFTEAISFVINCESQKEVDYYWEKLVAGGGEHVECGWLKDKYGLCWQVVPTALFDMIQDADRARVQRVMKAMMQMTKLDLAKLQHAYDET
jgi:predicted 3-demethylubiquinone-9 3-methyltransferase (glyoxalase superfamily)